MRESFARASGVLPIRRVAETPHVIAFHHPVPGFEPLHLLLVPKLAAPSIARLTESQRAQISAEVEQIAHDALAALGRSGSGFLVIVNGGPRQDVRQVHFHLLTDGYALAPAPASEPGAWTDISDPTCALHQVRRGDEPVLAGLEHAADAGAALDLERRGYSIIWDARDRGATGLVHLTAGPTR